MIVTKLRFFLVIMYLIISNQILGQNNSTCRVFFSSNSYILAPNEKKNLKTFIHKFDFKQNNTISIVGYCDDTGSEKYNDSLSVLRANNVREYLTHDLNLKKEVIDITIGKGELKTIENAKNKQTQQKNLNRRVDVTIASRLETKKNLLSDNLDIGDKITLDGILFIGGRTVLSPESNAVLDSLTKILKQKKDYHILIIGHINPENNNGMDARDSDTGLDNLSVARAKKIYDHFVLNGITASRLSYVGMKGLYPINKDGKYNRRVEIQIKKISKLDKTDSFQQLIERTKKQNELAETKYNRKVIAQLDSIYKDDQDNRIELETIEKKYGVASKEAAAQWKIIHEKDSINILKVSALLDKYGWLGYDVIGYKGATTLFLVVQHSSLEKQKKYLPLLKVAVKNKVASPSDLALLEDRVALQQGRKQVYGSQIKRDEKNNSFFVAPMIDPDNVDKRRASVDLCPIAEYVANWGIKWSLEEYKRNLHLK